MTVGLFDPFQELKGLCYFFVSSFFKGGFIIWLLCLQEGRPLWSAPIANNMQGIEGLYGLSSERVGWVDEMTGFSLLSLAFTS